MLARRLTTILPAMRVADALDTTRMHRVAGLTDGRTALGTSRPFRAPHQTLSDMGLIGGGQIPRPGAGSRAHQGVLFMDELPGVPAARPRRAPPTARGGKSVGTTSRASWILMFLQP
jgi:magnesium chelatase family protein